MIYVGSKTGRDGIHGATMASEEFDASSEDRRPTVQVGDPFTEKLLLEACLEVIKTDAVVGIQDMGAAGLTCSSFEMASRGGAGVELDLDRVPRREKGMSPFELMLSESQERMLLVTRPGREAEVAAIFSKWGLDAEVVGRVTDTGRVQVRSEGETVVDMPAHPLAEEAPVYNRPMARPEWLAAMQELDEAQVPEPGDMGAVLEDLLSSPNLCSRGWIARQYDTTVRTNTVLGPGADAAVIRLKGTHKAVAMTTDCNPRYCLLDPREGAAMAVAEAARNISCVGGEPLAITDCLNFGSPERPEIMWQFAEAVAGMGDACRALETPVVSGNVSFYNETEGRAVAPTPTVGMVGLLEDVRCHVGPWVQAEGDRVVLVGGLTQHLGASEYLALIHDREAGLPPRVDLDREKAHGHLIRSAVREGELHSAHDLSDGGLAVALAEMLFARDGRLGMDLRLAPPSGRLDATLFGEAGARYLVTLPTACMAAFERRASMARADLLDLGEVRSDRLRLRIGTEAVIDREVDSLRRTWAEALPRAMLATGVGAGSR